jgi:hypothetical protein
LGPALPGHFFASLVYATWRRSDRETRRHLFCPLGKPQAGRGGRAFWGGEQRSRAVGARSALVA